MQCVYHTVTCRCEQALTLKPDPEYKNKITSATCESGRNPDSLVWSEDEIKLLPVTLDYKSAKHKSVDW